MFAGASLMEARIDMRWWIENLSAETPRRFPPFFGIPCFFPMGHFHQILEVFLLEEGLRDFFGGILKAPQNINIV